MIEIGGQRWKILQVFFGADRSLFVSFPYFKHREGILAAATIPGSGQITSQINLESTGRVTSHPIKYSHHPDGDAHFSQDGKIVTQIRRRAVPLDRQRGHIFSALIQGLTGFDKADSKREISCSPSRTAITFQVPGPPEPEAIKLVGRWYGISSLPIGGAMPLAVGPIVTAQRPDGCRQDGFLIASPRGNAQHVLFMTCELIPRVGPEAELLCFYGGFDSPEVLNDPNKQAGFLTVMYPVSDVQSLKKTIGTVDLTEFK